MLQEFTLKTPHGDLNLAEGPANGPVLILLHGFTNRWQTFLPVIPTLAAKWQVLAFDHRGHGCSVRVPGGYTAAGFYTDSQEVLEYAFQNLSHQAPLALLGHSMGGSLALHLAQDHPDKIRALVTGDTSLALNIHVQVMNGRRNTKLFGLRRKLAGLPLEDLLRRGLPPEQAIEMSQLDPHVMDFHAEGRVQSFFEDVGDVDFDKIRCPLLLTQANPAKGGLLQDAELEPVLAEHPGFRFQRFDCGHDLQIDQGPGSPFIQAATAFLEGIEPL